MYNNRNVGRWLCDVQFEPQTAPEDHFSRVTTPETRSDFKHERTMSARELGEVRWTPMARLGRPVNRTRHHPRSRCILSA
ncbi:hypothetical protein [Enhygromyxa salina]|nr:hypothetical protein [Enhygromyxa salina]